MATVGTIQADLIANTSSFQSSMRAAAQTANQTLGQIQQQARATGSAISAMSASAAAFIGFDAVKAGVQSLLAAQMAAQQIRYSLISATGSTAQAGQAYDQVATIAQRLGLNLQTAETGFASMSAAAAANGVSMKDQMSLFDGLARSATVLHLSQYQVSDATLALSQMFGKGKIQAQELTQQLGNAIPGVVPRFQQAVLAMTAGTDLAGKSFDQLLQAGDLSVARFMPALIKALDETGAGADQAADGLNAATNRMSSAWFKLKADLSTGLLSDTATAGLNALATNLNNVAGMAGLIGGAVLSKLAGNAGNSVAASVGSAISTRQASLADAAASSQKAAAALAVADAELLEAQRGSDLIAVSTAAAAAARDAAAQMTLLASVEMDVAEAEAIAAARALELTDAMSAGAAGARSAAAFQAELAAAQDAYAASAATMLDAQERQSAATATVAAMDARAALAKERLTAATEAQAAATAAAEAAQASQAGVQAASSIGGLLASGASSVGSALLSLVGGPIGAAVLAIGGLAYAVYSYNERADEFTKKTDDQAKSLSQLTDQMQAGATGYDSITSSMSKFMDLYDSGGKQTSGIQTQIDQYQAQITRLQAVMSARDSSTSGGGNSTADYFDSKKIAQYQAAIDALSPSLYAAQQAQGAMMTQMQGTAAAIAGTAQPAMAALLDSLDELGLSTAKEYIVRLTVEANADAIDALNKKTQDAISKFQASTTSLSTKAATDSMTNAQKQRYALAQQLTAVQSSNLLTPDQKTASTSALTQAAAPAIQAAAQVDAADAAKKASAAAVASAQAQAQAYANLSNSQAGQLQSLQDEVDGNAKLSDAQRALNVMLAGGDSTFQKLSATQQADTIARQRNIVALTAQVTAMAQAKKQAEALGVVEDNLANIELQYAQSRQDSLASIGSGSQQTSDAQALTSIMRKYQDLEEQAGKQLTKGDITSDTYDKEVALYKASLTQELSDQKDFYSQRDAMQSDWLNGARAAMQDYQTSVNNVSSQVQSIWTDMADGMTSALASFATTGKLSFTSLANSIISDIAKMEAKAAVSGLMSLLTNALGVSSAQISGTTSTALTGINANISSLGSSLVGVTLGGGRASGGTTAGGTMYEVAENGRPELYTQGSKTYLLSGQDGYVTPATAGSSVVASGTSAASGGGGAQVNVYNNGGSTVTATTKQGANGKSIIDIVVDQALQRVASDISGGSGPVTSAMTSRYGFNKGANLR